MLLDWTRRGVAVIAESLFPYPGVLTASLKISWPVEVYDRVNFA